MSLLNLSGEQWMYVGCIALGIVVIIIHQIKRKNRKDDFERLDD